MDISINRIVSFFIIITFLFISACDDSSTEPKLVVDQKLVGTWELTKIITSIGSQDVELTPEAAGISSTVTFNSDLTFHSTSTDADGITTEDTGTWGTLNGELTIKITNGDTMKGPYKFLDNGDVSIDRTVKLSQGEIFATLVYSKKG
jgi:hypothetical protein